MANRDSPKGGPTRAAAAPATDVTAVARQGVIKIEDSEISAGVALTVFRAPSCKDGQPIRGLVAGPSLWDLPADDRKDGSKMATARLVIFNKQKPISIGAEVRKNHTDV